MAANVKVIPFKGQVTSYIFISCHQQKQYGCHTNC
jgi:hypothetical protein